MPEVFMQIVISHQTEGELRLPVNYRYVLQATIGKLIRQASRATRQIQVGPKDNYLSRCLFQFSGIAGSSRLEAENIVFDQIVSWEIRSIDEDLILRIDRAIRINGLDYAGKIYHNVRTTLSDIRKESTNMLIRMRTPMCVYEIDKIRKKTTYWTPADVRFYRVVYDNFRQKYTACYGSIGMEEIGLYPIHVTPNDKCIMKFETFSLSGWVGDYRLSGSPAALNFLFQVGLGLNNTLGFGMFEELSLQDLTD